MHQIAFIYTWLKYGNLAIEIKQRLLEYFLQENAISVFLHQNFTFNWLFIFFVIVCEIY